MRSIIGQVAGIIVLGSLIGAADAFVFRRLSTEREPPPAPVIPVQETGAKPVVPDQHSASEQASPPTAPATALTNFAPTPQDKLPSGHITLATAKQMFDAQAAVFVDARKMELFEESHVAGAFKIELHDFEQGDPQILMLIPRDSQVVIYCTGGNCDESEKVAQMMQGSGYSKCYVMHDGLPGWQAMGWPVEQGRGMMP